MSMIPSHSYSNRLNPAFMSDIVFVGEEGSFNGHMAVFASLSKFLKEIFLSTPVFEEETVILVPEAKDEELKQMISFIYGVTREVRHPSDLFRRLGLLGGRPEDRDLKDHNRNVLEDPEIEAAEVLIDNDELFCQTDSQSPLFCILCNNGFSSEAGLREHLKHHPICVLCNNQFIRNSDLLEHWQSHPQCGICGDRVVDQAALEEHEVGHDNFEDSLATLATHHSNLVNDPLIDGCRELYKEVNPDLEIHDVQFVNKELEEDIGILLKCDYCVETFVSMLDLENHSAKEHFGNGSKPPFEVSDYDEVAVDTDDYEQVIPSQETFYVNLPSDFQAQLPVNEINWQTNSQPICAICKVSFSKLSELSHHVLKSHPVDCLDSGRFFACKFCADIGYQQLRDLEVHYGMEHKSEAHNYRCPDCSKEFKTARFLRKHIRNHLQEKAFQCGLCLAVISTEVTMRAHTRKCLGKGANSELQLKQPNLGEKQAKVKKISAINNFDKDIPQADVEQPLEGDLETRSKRFTCKGCGKMFKDRIQAEFHIPKCGKLLTEKKKEIVPGQGVEEFPNTQKDFDNEALIDVRVQISEEISRPRNHRCELCEKTFLTGSHLKEHMIQHTRIFPFNCPICARGFKRKNMFQNHVCNPQVENTVESYNDDSGLDNLKKELIDEIESTEHVKVAPAPSPQLSRVSGERLVSSQADLNADIDMNSIITGTSRSGRQIKQKKFFEDLAPLEETKRKRKRKLVISSSEAVAVDASRSKCARTSTQCATCELELRSHSELCRHLLSHVPEEVVKTLPVYAEGDTGWCQNCEQPLPVTHADLHMAEKHQELLSLSAGPAISVPAISVPAISVPAISDSSPSPQLVTSLTDSDLIEENHNQESSTGNLTEQSERFLEEVNTALEEEEEFCADLGREMADHDPVVKIEVRDSARSQYNLKNVYIKLEKIKLNK